MEIGNRTRILLGLKRQDGARQVIVWDTDEISVGRAPDNDIVVDCEDVSRHHLIFTRGHADCSVKDLHTANGTIINGTPVQEPHLLETKDIVEVGGLEITFIRTKKDPASLGLEVVFASQLKAAADSPILESTNPEATILALGEASDEGLVVQDFKVGAVGDYGFDPTKRGPAAAPPPVAEPDGLDLDLGDEFISPASGGGVVDPVTGAAPAAAGETLSLTLELQGLSPEMQGQLVALFGKVIELPALRLRIKDGDLD